MDKHKMKPWKERLTIKIWHLVSTFHRWCLVPTINRFYLEWYLVRKKKAKSCVMFLNYCTMVLVVLYWIFDVTPFLWLALAFVFVPPFCEIINFVQKINKFKSSSILDNELDRRKNATITREEESVLCKCDELKLHTYKGSNSKTYVAYSQEINDFLIMCPKISISINEQHSKRMQALIKDYVKEFDLVLRKKLSIANADNAFFYNHKKLCLVDDIKIGMEEVVCGKGEYYDTYLTNRVWNKELCNIQGDRCSVMSSQLQPCRVENSQLLLKPIPASRMNNGIGISTIGITEDNYIFFWRQSPKTSYSQNMYVPTGNGSCDWKDYEKTKNFNNNNGDFIATLKHGMERELCEESQLVEFANPIKNTIVLGYYRCINSGGKPEFAGITKLTCHSTELRPNETEVTWGLSYKFTSIEHLKKIISEILDDKSEMRKEDMSVSLEMNLVFLREFCVKNERAMDDFCNK